MKRSLRALILICAAAWRLVSPVWGDQTLGTPVFGVAPGAAQVNLINCEDTNFQYVVQTSANLQDWISVSTDSAIPSGSPVTVPATNATCFYRLRVVPSAPVSLFQYAILTSSNFNLAGNGSTIDSFDSGSTNYSTSGQYEAIKRKANADVATDLAIVGGGNINVYGNVHTGPGTASNVVQIGPNGAGGDLAWCATHHGIQSNHWAANFNMYLTNVAVLNRPSTGLPSASNSTITLNGGYYFAISAPTAYLNITGPTTLWVMGSYSPAGITIASTNNASLVVYVGTTNAGGNDILTLGSNGSFNQPGYSANLVFLGFPSLKSISFVNDVGFAGCIYAPEADIIAGGGGNNTLDTCGSIIAKSLTLTGHWNFHYDEALKTSGPAF
ncbi:MAG: hypothetical protein JWR26_2902 [Pedosphaera sp.]|nr:hypothetical protein [Pedosphaera sp.]